MREQNPLIGIVKTPEVPDRVIETIAAYIIRYMDLETKVFPSIELPNNAFDPARGQYEAGAIIKNLESMDFSHVSKVICVFSVDLFVPVFTHVFGEARQGGRIALVSLFRLREKRADEAELSPKLLKRTAKVALHELSHLFDLHHCERKHCLMHFSGLIDDLDQTPAEFCDYCIKYFQTAVSRRTR
jgi:archaemetzincin